MKHPSAEELVSWVYGEVPPRAGRQLSAHVKGCAECRQQVESWQGAMKTLDELPAPAARKRYATAPVQWAAAAALFVALGIVIGRFAISTDEAKLRAAMQNDMQQQVAAMRVELGREFAQGQTEVMEGLVAANTERLGTEFADMLEQARAEDRATYLLALKELNAKHDAEVATLKKGLETVVALADYGFEATEQRFEQLAAATRNTEQE
jgi:anti-sigma factor ChrR (cupin superfamily)